MPLKILTWNIHKGIGGFDRRYRLARVAETIAAIAPDVALLQEVADGWPPAGRDLQAEILAEATGLEHFAFSPEHRFSQGGYGNAILSRFPILDRHRIDLKIDWRKQRSALQARLLIPAGDPSLENAPRLANKLLVTSLHLGLAEGERRKQVTRLLAHDRLASQGSPSVLGGDFNDVFNTLAREIPLSHQRAGTRQRSFPAMFPVFCLDGIYVSGLTVHASYIFRESNARTASDHLPLVAEVTPFV